MSSWASAEAEGVFFENHTGFSKSTLCRQRQITRLVATYPAVVFLVVRLECVPVDFHTLQMTLSSLADVYKLHFNHISTIKGWLWKPWPDRTALQNAQDLLILFQHSEEKAESSQPPRQSIGPILRRLQLHAGDNKFTRLDFTPVLRVMEKSKTFDTSNDFETWLLLDIKPPPLHDNVKLPKLIVCHAPVHGVDELGVFYIGDKEFPSKKILAFFSGQVCLNQQDSHNSVFQLTRLSNGRVIYVDGGYSRGVASYLNHAQGHEANARLVVRTRKQKQQTCVCIGVESTGPISPGQVKAKIKQITITKNQTNLPMKNQQ
jgi:hypothetical protein